MPPDTTSAVHTAAANPKVLTVCATIRSRLHPLQPDIPREVPAGRFDLDPDLPARTEVRRVIIDEDRDQVAVHEHRARVALRDQQKLIVVVFLEPRIAGGLVGESV